MEACEEYRASTGRRISFEWACIEDVNDRPSDARELAALARPLGGPCEPHPAQPDTGRSLERPQRLWQAAGLVAAGMAEGIRRQCHYPPEPRTFDRRCMRSVGGLRGSGVCASRPGTRLPLTRRPSGRAVPAHRRGRSGPLTCKASWMAMNIDPDPRRAERRRSTKETEVSVLARVSTGREPRRRTRACRSSTTCWPSSASTVGLTSTSSRGVTSKSMRITPSRTPASSSGRPSPRRSAPRWGSAVSRPIALPLDEALVEVALDLSGRPYLHYEVAIGEAAPLGSPPFEVQLAEEFWRAFVHAAALTLHIELRRGRNPHHVLEASFKGVGRALKDAARIEASGIPSTKGLL